MIKLKYLQCQRAGYHEGELLNIVCLNSECKPNSLCCCVCVDQLHKGHKTTTLKKILIDANQSAKEAQQSEKQQVKPSVQLSNDIISNLIDSSKKDTFKQLKQSCEKIRSLLHQVEEGMNDYYKKVQEVTQNKDNSNPSMKIFQSVENIQGALSIQSMQSSLQQLLNSMDEVKKQKLSKSNNKQLAQQSIINLIENSNREVADTTLNRLAQIQTQLQKNYQAILKATAGVKNLFNKEVFYFSSQLKSPEIWVSDSYKVTSKKNQHYQVALMQPSISWENEITAFRFKITKSVANWIAIGMCYKNILKKKNFLFDYKTIGHGCYLISSNGGSWSHSTEQLNNKVKAFTFKQGDIITCIVNKKMREIFFTKQLSPGLLTVPMVQRQIYELPYVQDPFDNLHPCVAFYFENDAVEYLPAINLNSIPKYDYLFSTFDQHLRVKVIDYKIIKALEGASEYRAVLLDKTLEENMQTPKKFSFKILKSTNNWVAVGMCYSKTAATSNYGFNYQSPLHGYYMVSSNGGSWSPIDSSKNNVVKTLKFGQGDTVQCEVIFGLQPNSAQNKIIFSKGIEKYELNFKVMPGDKLYPCAMLYYPSDQIAILPSF